VCIDATLRGCRPHVYQIKSLYRFIQCATVIEMSSNVCLGEDTVEIPVHYHRCRDGQQQVRKVDGEKGLSCPLSAPEGACMLTSHTPWRSAAIPLPVGSRTMSVSGMCSRVGIAVPRPLVPILVYAANPRILCNTGCVTSCKSMTSISCLRMKSSATLLEFATPGHFC
jgi:hypothetical protein